VVPLRDLSGMFYERYIRPFHQHIRADAMECDSSSTNCLRWLAVKFLPLERSRTGTIGAKGK
jgi:hypothetical protein